MNRVQSYRDLLIWQRGIDLVALVYELTYHFPKHETYALADQLRRSVVSVPSNIAEGQSRQHTSEFRQFLYVAKGSLSEVDTQIIIAQRLGYVSREKAIEVENQVIELKKMINALISKLPKKRPNTNH